MGNIYHDKFRTLSIVTLGSCFEALGYSVQYIALDVSSKPPLLQFKPSTICLNPCLSDELSTAFDRAADADEDITIIDCPSGGWIDDFIHLAATAQSGSGSSCPRFVISPIVNSLRESSVEFGLEFTKLFHAIDADDIIIAHHWQEDPERLGALFSRKGRLLTEIAEERIIEFSFLINRFKSTPLQLDFDSCLRSVSMHAPWITGKPLPNSHPTP